MKTALSVNLNKIALLRNARGRNYPNLQHWARRCLDFGANGVTIHPRPDQRHARYQDVADLKIVIQEYPDAELNIEGNPAGEFIDVVLASQPHQCTLVPDDPGQLTSDHGWDVEKNGQVLAPVIDRLRRAGIRVSLFMDPVAANMPVAAELGADRIELYTEAYAMAFARQDIVSAILADYREAARSARTAGMGVNAGHDLSLENLGRFLTIPDIAEVSIGHALTVESLEFGFEATIRSYLNVIDKAEALQPEV